MHGCGQVKRMGYDKASFTGSIIPVQTGLLNVVSDCLPAGIVI